MKIFFGNGVEITINFPLYYIDDYVVKSKLIALMLSESFNSLYLKQIELIHVCTYLGGPYSYAS